MFAQRVTSCERRESHDACPECALRFGRLPANAADQFHATATHAYLRIAQRQRGRRRRTGSSVRCPRSHRGAPFSHAEEEEHAEGRAMIALTGMCLGLLLVGVVLERVVAPENIGSHLLYGAAAVAGGWFAAQSTFSALPRRLKFDVNLLMILAAVGAAAIGYIFEAAVLMFLFSLSPTRSRSTRWAAPGTRSGRSWSCGRRARSCGARGASSRWRPRTCAWARR